MPVWLISLISSILGPVLSWFFSGSETTVVNRSPGVEGLDRATLADAGVSRLPVLVCLICALPFIGGCQIGGTHETHDILFVEPGATVEIATDKKIPIIAKNAKNEEVLGERSLAGQVSMPKSVYRELLVKAYPELRPEIEKQIQVEKTRQVK